MSFKKLGDYIKQVDERNDNSSVTLLRGVSTSKKFIESKANMTGVSLHNYKVCRPGQFAYVSDTSRRGDKIAIAYNANEEFIVSSVYTVFECDTKFLIPEFLFIWFNRPEFDRYARFNSWGSARETFDWDSMCSIMMPIPSLSIQGKYAALYQGLMKNLRAFEAGMDDLQVCCETYMQRLVQTEESKRLGDFIEQLSERNVDSKISKVQGLSISKRFIESKANLNGVDLSSYKKVKPRNFAYIPVTSRSGDKIAIAMNAGATCIISASYITFEVVESRGLIPEFLLIWFNRPEFDRYARFNSWGSARETFDWDSMCSIMMPIPDLEKQKAIVAMEKTMRERKRINEDLKSQIKSICPVLMSGVVKTELVSTRKE